MNARKLEYLPYTIPIPKALKIANRIAPRKVRTLATALLENQELIEKLPEDLQELIHAARIREVVKRGRGSEYLVRKLRKNKTLLVRLLRLINTDNFFSEDSGTEREIIELSEPGYVKICIKYYYNSSFNFQKLNPINVVKINRKSKSVFLQTLGSCSHCYHSSRRTKSSDITASKTITTLKDFPGILMTFYYDISRKYYHTNYGSTSSFYSRVYGVIYGIFTASAISFRLKSNISHETSKAARTIKELLKLLPQEEKRKVKAWIEKNHNQSKVTHSMKPFAIT